MDTQAATDKANPGLRKVLTPAGPVVYGLYCGARQGTFTRIPIHTRSHSQLFTC